MTIGCSLHIGVPRVEPTLPEAAVPLPAAENDAIAMLTIAQQQGFRSETLIAERATADSILNSIRRNADSLKPGDIFLISFSGHGRQLPGSQGRKQENAWVTYDRPVGREELQSALSQFKKGVRIVGISDCCFSQKILPVKLNFLEEVLGPSNFVIKAVPRVQIQARTNSRMGITTRNPDHHGKLKATAIIFSSSRSNALSIFLTSHGLFTQKLLAVWDNSRFGGSYHDFFLAVRYAMMRIQAPAYEVRGPRDPKFEKERPFTI
jgi:metacaspase-1